MKKMLSTLITAVAMTAMAGAVESAGKGSKRASQARGVPGAELGVC